MMFNFQLTFVHITLLRQHSLCICTCVCVCLDKIYHHASKCRQKRLEKLSIFVSEKEMVQYISFHLQRLSTFMSCSRPVFTYTQSLYFCICNLWFQARSSLIIVQDIPFPPREYERNCLTSNNDIIPQLQNPNAPLTITTLSLSPIRKWILISAPPAAIVGPLY